jgi:hypothetical protein
MILRAWSGVLIDTAEYGWPVVLRVARGWVRYALDGTAPGRCPARSETGRRCWERRGHRRPHGHTSRTKGVVYGARPVHYGESPHQSYEHVEYRWVEEERS